MLSRLAIAFGLLLLVPLLGIPLWVATHHTDLPAPPGDADLAIALPELADADNGFTRVLRAGELAALTHEDDGRLRALLAGYERDDAWVRRTLRENRTR